MLRHMFDHCMREEGFDKYVVKKVHSNEYRVKSTEYFTPDRLLRYGGKSINNLVHKNLFKAAIELYKPRYIGTSLVYGGYNNMTLNGITGDSAVVLGE